MRLWPLHQLLLFRARAPEPMFMAHLSLSTRQVPTSAPVQNVFLLVTHQASTPLNMWHLHGEQGVSLCLGLRIVAEFAPL